jgi:Xaa-Pro aminopeptidase
MGIMLLILLNQDLKKRSKGFEVDDDRKSLLAGYGKYFIHRTGHSITTDLHGSGTLWIIMKLRMRNPPSTSFSIEPGIYLKGDFGVRSEIDVYIKPDGKVEVTGGKDEEIIPVLL